VLHLRGPAEALVQEFSARAPWGWKDPRTSLTLPFWRGLAPDLKVIVCVRHPFEVALSLRRRSGASYAFGILLWTLYNRELLARVDPSWALVVHYASILADPERELRRIAEFLRFWTTPAIVAHAARSAQGRLRHSRFTAQDLVAGGVGAEPVQLYRRLCE